MKRFFALNQKQQAPVIATSVQYFIPTAPASTTELLPTVACVEPDLVSLVAGKKYAWCSCGLSQRQPFCDGSHAGTDWKPLMFSPKRTQLDWLCTCKFTRDPPYCDAAHNRLVELQARRIKELSVVNKVANIPWLADAPVDHQQPRIVLIHGFMAGQHMASHLLRWLRDAGFVDVSLFSNNASPNKVADFLQEAKGQGRKVALIGYSQGGFQVLKVAKRLASRNVGVDAVVSIAAGGVGRLHPAQWFFPVRRIPKNIHTLLNIYSHADGMGTDPIARGNALPNGVAQQVVNVALAKTEGVDHIALVRCYPLERQHPAVTAQVLTPILATLNGLSADNGT